MTAPASSGREDESRLLAQEHISSTRTLRRREARPVTHHQSQIGTRRAAVHRYSI